MPPTALSIDSVVLVMIDQLKRDGKPFGIRALVETCHLADKTITKAINRLEKEGRLAVTRGSYGMRYHYEVLDPPNELDQLAASIHLAERI